MRPSDGESATKPGKKALPKTVRMASRAHSAYGATTAKPAQVFKKNIVLAEKAKKNEIVRKKKMEERLKQWRSKKSVLVPDKEKKQQATPSLSRKNSTVPPNFAIKRTKTSAFKTLGASRRTRSSMHRQGAIQDRMGMSYNEGVESMANLDKSFQGTFQGQLNESFQGTRNPPASKKSWAQEEELIVIPPEKPEENKAGNLLGDIGLSVMKKINKQKENEKELERKIIRLLEKRMKKRFTEMDKGIEDMRKDMKARIKKIKGSSSSDDDSSGDSSTSEDSDEEFKDAMDGPNKEAWGEERKAKKKKKKKKAKSWTKKLFKAVPLPAPFINPDTRKPIAPLPRLATLAIFLYVIVGIVSFMAVIWYMQATMPLENNVVTTTIRPGYYCFSLSKATTQFFFEDAKIVSNCTYSSTGDRREPCFQMQNYSTEIGLNYFENYESCTLNTPAYWEFEIGDEAMETTRSYIGYEAPPNRVIHPYASQLDEDSLEAEGYNYTSCLAYDEDSANLDCPMISFKLAYNESESLWIKLNVTQYQDFHRRVDNTKYSGTHETPEWCDCDDVIPLKEAARYHYTYHGDYVWHHHPTQSPTSPSGSRPHLEGEPDVLYESNGVNTEKKQKKIRTLGGKGRKPTRSPTRTPTSNSPTTCSPSTTAPTSTYSPSTCGPTTSTPVTGAPTSLSPISATPTTSTPVTGAPTSLSPFTATPTTSTPVTGAPTSLSPSQSPTTTPTTCSPATRAPTSLSPSQSPSSTPTTGSPTTQAPSSTPTTCAPSTSAPSSTPTTCSPTSCSPTTVSPTTSSPSTCAPTTLSPTTMSPTSCAPTTLSPTTMSPTSCAPTSCSPVTKSPVSLAPSSSPTTCAPTSLSPSTMSPSTCGPTSCAPTSLSPSTVSPSSCTPTTCGPTTCAPTSLSPSTCSPSTCGPTSCAPTSLSPSTMSPSTCSPSSAAPTSSRWNATVIFQMGKMCSPRGSPSGLTKVSDSPLTYAMDRSTWYATGAGTSSCNFECVCLPMNRRTRDSIKLDLLNSLRISWNGGAQTSNDLCAPWKDVPPYSCTKIEEVLENTFFSAFSLAMGNVTLFYYGLIFVSVGIVKMILSCTAPKKENKPDEDEKDCCTKCITSVMEMMGLEVEVEKVEKEKSESSAIFSDTMPFDQSQTNMASGAWDRTSNASLIPGSPSKGLLRAKAALLRRKKNGQKPSMIGLNSMPGMAPLSSQSTSEGKSA